MFNLNENQMSVLRQTFALEIHKIDRKKNTDWKVFEHIYMIYPKYREVTKRYLIEHSIEITDAMTVFSVYKSLRPTEYFITYFNTLLSIANVINRITTISKNIMYLRYAMGRERVPDDVFRIIIAIM